MNEPGAVSDTWEWRSNTADCVWSSYGDDHVVFHRASGQTHFLNAAGYRLLTEILLKPRTTSAVAVRLSATGDGEDVRPQVEDVHAMLVRFEYLGLVDRSVPVS